jgi:hypothetical protein
MSSGSGLIAGWKTAGDWQALRAVLVIGGVPGLWKQAFVEFFQTRLELRYLNPIKVLQNRGTFQGEGFSILAIQCTLIEFLESTIQGIKYRHLRRGETLGSDEYWPSRDVFVSFLVKREPFAREFDSQLAVDFYAGVRCGLLHEARTKDGWRVWARGPDGTTISRDRRIVYRDNFQEALEAFIASYGAALVADTELQKAFLRKFDDLCE